jgi:predicted TIM-barrel fold metal-dependent hydrolase
MSIGRRQFLAGIAASPLLVGAGCRDDERYSPADTRILAAQRTTEAANSGKGPYGVQRYEGYRGLADLPYFELDDAGSLRCTVENLPAAIDVHTHLGISLLLAPNTNLLASTPRVEHVLDCDAEEPGCPLDLDVYINGNFRPADMRSLHWNGFAQLTFGSSKAATHTVPNLIAEMDATRIAQAVVLPIAFGLPFGDDLTERFMEAIEQSGTQKRLLPAASVHASDPHAVEKLHRYAKAGAKMVKLHPAGGRFFPDAEEMHPIYRACGELGLPIIFHGGRAGIEPEYTHQFTLIRHYEGALRKFPDVQFILGHAGARDFEDAILLAERFQNVWFGIHGQGVTMLDRLIRTVGHERLLFGTDWPFYHLAATLAKVLLVTEGSEAARYALLRGNAEKLLGIENHEA